MNKTIQILFFLILILRIQTCDNRPEIAPGIGGKCNKVYR